MHERKHIKKKNDQVRAAGRRNGSEDPEKGESRDQSQEEYQPKIES